MANTNVEIDLDALQAEVAGMTQEDLMKQVLDLRTKQKIQQKKYQNTPAQKAYRAKRAEMQKAMIARAKELGLYDEIKAQAEKAADAKIADEKALEDLEDEEDVAA